MSAVEGDSWIEARIAELEVKYLERVFACETPEAVEAAVTYAAHLARVGLTPESCPVFLRLLEIRNPWVIDALVGDQDPYQLLSRIQPGPRLVSHVFATLERWKRGGVGSKNLAAALGVLRSVYAAPREGFRIFPLKLGDLHSLAKHLDKKAGQDEPNNRVILDCLDKLSSLDNPENPDMDRIAVQSSAIRNAFFDETRKLEDVIPPNLLDIEDKVKEVSPREAKPLAAARSAGAGGGEPRRVAKG